MLTNLYAAVPKRLRRAAGALLALLIALPCMQAAALSVTVAYPASEAVLVNPYIGSAVWASDDAEHEQPFTLVYADLTWAEFEPEQGVYDFASFEDENQLEHWRAEGKHLVFRFVIDVPSDKNHRDIPAWLYQATDKDGTSYSVSYGRGYSPNYANAVLIQAHTEAIAALGERYGNDPFVAYVELGSLGHWGEWHVHQKLGLMPSAAVRDQYVLPYIDAFPNAFLMMRRPFAIAADFGLGLFNDTSGEPVSTEKWLAWISDGGDYESPDGAGALLPMPDVWQSAPIGGELTTGVKRETLLQDSFAQTLSLFIQSHTSWIGPGSFADIERDGKEQAALDEINHTIGYRLRVTQCSVSETAQGQTQFVLDWTNDGIAPFYFDWQPTLSVLDSQGAETLLPLAINLMDILPEQTVSTTITLPSQTVASSAYTLRVGIVNPATGDPGVALAMQARQDGLWYELVQINEP